MLVERSPFGVALIGADGRYKYINPKFVDIFHYTLEDIRSGRDWFNKAFPDPEYRKQAITSWQEDLKPPEDMESGVYREFDVRCKDDSTKRILFRNVNLQSGEQLVFYEDITEKRRLEAHLLHAQKLESMGTLTSGVAHNFRNILAGISMNAQLAKLKYAGVQGLTDVVERIDDSVSAGSQLVEELMAFSRKKTGQGFQLINLSTIIRDTCQLIRASFDKKIQIQIHAPMDLCIHGDPSGLGQVFMNLCTNARDAMPDGGELRIEAEKAGRQAVVVISDTGHGMDKESREKCFDPFFTTKDVDKGTGLGLWTAYGIVKHHGGQIHVSSEPGKGATFKLCFHLASSNETIIDRPEASTVRGKGQKVLIVDDETDIAFPLKELLENMGYQATHVPSGQAALDTYATWRPDAVLIDRNMPGMDGITCMRKLMKLDPSARTILISGYQETGPDGIDAQTRSLIKAYLTKPIHVADLGRILTQLFEPADDVASS